MKKDVSQPFNRDVETSGGYIYANPARRSARYANRRFSDIIHSSLDFRGKTVVDVGCGDGTYTAVLREETSAATIVGIDPASSAVERARRKYSARADSLEFRTGVAATLLNEDLHFDIAIYRGVIHHVGDPVREIEVAMHLADQVFFLEPNGWNPVLKFLERFSRYHRDHEEQSFVLRRYKTWIERSGGSVQRAFFFGLVPMFAPDWFVPMASSLEPVVERTPVLRRIACGQVGILAKGHERARVS